MTRAAVYAGTRNVYKYMLIAAKSLLKNTKMDKIYFLIEDDEFPESLPPVFECINVSHQTYFKEDGPNFKSNWSYMILMRAALTKVLPQDLDKVLSLDIDTIVNDDISELWDWDLQHNYIMAAREPSKSFYNKTYINFGVCMINLKELRKDKLDNEIIFALNNRKFAYPEQDVFSEKCQGKIKLLPADYNVCSVTGKVWEKKKIFHYASVKSNIWEKYELPQLYTNMSFEDIL